MVSTRDRLLGCDNKDSKSQWPFTPRFISCSGSVAPVSWLTCSTSLPTAPRPPSQKWSIAREMGRMRESHELDLKICINSAHVTSLRKFLGLCNYTMPPESRLGNLMNSRKQWLQTPLPASDLPRARSPPLSGINTFLPQIFNKDLLHLFLKPSK